MRPRESRFWPVFVLTNNLFSVLGDETIFTFLKQSSEISDLISFNLEKLVLSCSLQSLVLSEDDEARLLLCLHCETDSRCQRPANLHQWVQTRTSRLQSAEFTAASSAKSS